jgi:hypothetical protein
MDLGKIMNWIDIFKQAAGFFTPSAPVIPSFDGTQLSLVRKATDTWCTQGELSINGSFVCYTIELPKVEHNGSNVCIQPGTYSVSLYQGSRWPFKTPLLATSAIGRTFIEIHPSNYAIRPSDGQVFLEGCIAPGLSQGQDFDNSSKDAWDLMMSKIDWTKPVQIIITEEI